MQPDMQALRAWSGIDLVGPLAGGARNPVFLARRGGQQVVVRRSGRATAALEWELDLQEHLRAHGIRVPEVVPADDGRRHVDRAPAKSRFVHVSDGPTSWPGRP